MTENNGKIKLIIDGQTVEVAEGATILEASQTVQSDIPVLCYHEATSPNGLCRLCVVDVDEGRLLQPACIAICQPDTNVETNNERIMRSRRTILEMLNASVNLEEAPELQVIMQAYDVDMERFPGAKQRAPELIDDNPFYVRDYAQCVTCWRCVQVCADDAQYTFALTLQGRGHDTQVTTAFDIPLTESPCVFCGQCIGVCPTGALKPKAEWGLVLGLNHDEIRAMTRYKKRKDDHET